MTVAATEATRRPAVARSTVVVGLAALAAVSLAVGDSWIVDNIEVPITRDLCGGSCTGIESDVSATGPVAIAVLALGLLGIWNAVRGHFTSLRSRTIIAASGVILTTVALSAFAVVLVRVGLFGSRFPTGTETCFVGPRGGDCIRPSPASWAWPAVGIVFASAAAAVAVTRR